MTDPTATAPAFVAKSETRAKGAKYLSIGTRDELLSPARLPDLLKMAKDIGGRFARHASFVCREDFEQEAMAEILAAAKRWKPESGTPCGGFCYCSVTLKLQTRMYEASVPVSGSFNNAAECAAIGKVAMDAPAGDEGGSTIGALMDSGAPTAEEFITARNERAEMYRTIFEGYGAVEADLVLAVLHGEDPASLKADLPRGLTPHGLANEAAKVRERLRAHYGYAAPSIAAEPPREDTLATLWAF